MNLRARHPKPGPALAHLVVIALMYLAFVAAMQTRHYATAAVIGMGMLASHITDGVDTILGQIRGENR